MGRMVFLCLIVPKTFERMVYMRKIYKIVNIALVFMVIGVLVCPRVVYCLNLRPALSFNPLSEDSIDILARKEWQTPGNLDLFAYSWGVHSDKIETMYEVFKKRYGDSCKEKWVYHFLDYLTYTRLFIDTYKAKHVNVLDSLIEGNELLFRMFDIAARDYEFKREGFYSFFLRYPDLIDKFKSNIKEILEEKRSLGEKKVTILIPGCTFGQEMISWKWILETKLGSTITDFDDFEFEIIGVENNRAIYNEAQLKWEYGFDVFSALDLPSSTTGERQGMLEKLNLMNHVNENIVEYRKSIKIIFGDITSENFEDILKNSDLVIINNVMHQVKGWGLFDLLELFRSVSESHSSMRVIGEDVAELKALQENL